jgi:hypothetical protein
MSHTLKLTPIAATSFERHLRAKAPVFLYHYTNHDGLLGIANSRELWASEVGYLNDAREFHTAVDMALERLNSELPPLGLFTLSPTHSPRQIAAKNLWHFTRKVTAERSRVFVASFCSNGDLLSQWRGYSGESYGISIGFHTTQLKQVALRKGFSLGKCIYDRIVQKRMISEVTETAIKRTLSIYDRKVQKRRISEVTETAIRRALSHDDEHEKAFRDFVASLSRIAVLFKNESFSEEDEWRLSFSADTTDQTDVRFRRGRSTLIPYVTLPFMQKRTSPVDHVYVGPCPNMGLSQSSVAWLLSKTNLLSRSRRSKAAQAARASQIPFRNW